MTVRALESRRIPAPWTQEHVALLDSLRSLGIDPADARPEWWETVVAIEGPDGEPAGMGVTRSAGVSNCPIR
jgi:hypothetical protein